MSTISSMEISYYTLGALSATKDTQNNKTPISFKDFSNLLNQNEIVNKNYSRDIPKDFVLSTDYNLSKTNDSKQKETELQLFDYYKKAYSLGLVDLNNQLIGGTSSQSTSSTPVDSEQSKDSKSTPSIPSTDTSKHDSIQQNLSPATDYIIKAASAYNNCSIFTNPSDNQKQQHII